ncbi:hypothetical protein Bca4012_096920 [Brassica carinata]
MEVTWEQWRSQTKVLPEAVFHRGQLPPLLLPPSATAWEDVFYELRLTLLTAIALSISWLLPKNKTNTYSARCMLQDLVRGVFPRSGCFVFGDGCCVVYLHGDAIGKALKLSGGSVGGFKIVVHEVLPIKKVGGGGVSNARGLAMAEKDEAARLAMAEKDKAILCEGNQKTIMTTD